MTYPSLHLIRRAVPCALALTGMTIVSAAQAGTYDVVSCGSAAAITDATDNAWEVRTDSTAWFTTTRLCPPNGGQFSGLTLYDQLGVQVAERPTQGQFAEWRLTAPSGTTIVRLLAYRDLGIRDASLRTYARNAAGIDLNGGSESCTIPGGQFTCDVGGPTKPAVDITGLDTTAVRYGIACFDTPTVCGTGATLHNAWVNLYGTTVTINDPVDPTIDAVGGPLFSDGWKRGTVSATATASDVTGIKEVRFYDGPTLVDGATIDRSSQCDYSTVAPCANPAAGASFALNTALLADGSHTVHLAAVDATGTNETKAAGRQVQVDNTAPTKPTNLRVSGGGASPTFDVAFDIPAQTDAPITGAMYEACNGGICVNGARAASGATGTISGLTLPAGGTYTVKVWLVDEAGNGAYANAATGTVTYDAPSGGGFGGGGGGGGAGGGGGGGATPPTTPPGPSGPPTSPTPSAPNAPPVPTQPTGPTTPASVTGAAKVSRTGRLTVDGRISRAARGKVIVTYRGRIRGAWVTRSVRAQIKGGRYHALMRLPSGWKHARSVRITARYGGSSTVRAQTKRLKVTSTTG